MRAQESVNIIIELIGHIQHQKGCGIYLLLVVSHYENLPMQYTEIFSIVKIEFFL